MITDSNGNECTDHDWDALWASFHGDPDGEQLLSMLTGVLSHPEMVMLWKMVAVMDDGWDVPEAVRTFPDLQYRGTGHVRQALQAMRLHPPPRE